MNNFTIEQKIGETQSEINTYCITNIPTQTNELLGVILNTEVYFQKLTLKYYTQEVEADIKTIRALLEEIEALKEGGRTIDGYARGELDSCASLLFLASSEKMISPNSILRISGVEDELSGTVSDIEEGLSALKEYNNFILSVLKTNLNEELYRKCEKAIRKGKTVHIKAKELYEANIAIIM